MRRLTILLAMLAALMLVPVVGASATPKFKLNIIGQPGTSGEATSDSTKTGSPYDGTPKIQCKYEYPGPATGVCENESDLIEKGFWGVTVKVENLKLGTKVKEWEFVSGKKFALCGPGHTQCSALTPKESENIEVNLYLAPIELKVNIIGEAGGGGEVKSPAAGYAFPGTPALACVLPEGEGSVQEGVCKNRVEEPAPGTVAEGLEAIPGPNSEIVKWKFVSGESLGGTCGAGGAECRARSTQSKDVEINVYFKCKAGKECPESPLYPLTVTKTGEGSGTVTSEPAGIACGSECSEEYEEGTEVTLSASEAEGSEFTGWSGCESEPEGKCEVTMSEAREVTANFDEEAGPEGPPLTLNIEEGQGTVVSNPSGLECSGEAPKSCLTEEIEAGSVLLTASPAAGYTFLSWKYCDKGGVNGRQCTISLNEAKTVGARFAKTWQLSASKAGAGLGKVQSSPGGILCLFACSETGAAFREGPVTVKQAAAKHHHFVGWLGDCTGSEPTCVLTMDEDHQVEAEFAEDAKHLLSLAKEGGGQGLVKSTPSGLLCGYTCSAGAASFYAGEEVAVSVKLNKGTAKVTWTTGAGTCTGSSEALESTCTVTMSAAKSLVAKFD